MYSGEVKKQDKMSWGLDSLARWDSGPRRRKGRPGEVENRRSREYESKAPSPRGWPASRVVAKSHFKLPKAQFKVVQGWELAYSWLKREQMRGRVQNSESDTSGTRSCFLVFGNSYF